MRDLVLNRRSGRRTTIATFLLHHQAACLARPAAAGEALPSLMRYTRPLSVCSETRLRPSFLRTTPARKPRTECCCHSVAVTREAIVAPAGVRSIAMMRACLVLGPAAGTGLDDAGAGRLRDTGLATFRAVERVAAFDLDFGLVMGSSEVCATPSVAPPQPRPAKHPAGPDPKARLSRPKSPQQRSDHARKPVISEQDSCSLAWMIALMSGLSRERYRTVS